MNRQTAIRGSKIFPQVVIKLLENSGGINEFKHVGNDVTGYYYINSKNNIVCNNPESVPEELEKTDLNFRPALFSTVMVKALINRLKFQTRRILNPQPALDFSIRYDGIDYEDGKKHWFEKTLVNKSVEDYYGPITCKYGEPGDILWVRETWAARTCNTTNGEVGIEYLATPGHLKKVTLKNSVMILPTFIENYGNKKKWKPSIHMPAGAARIFLRIKSICIERLNDISKKDAIAEGINRTNALNEWYFHEGIYNTNNPVIAYQKLWESINGKGSWNTNPWVWVIEFELI